MNIIFVENKYKTRFWDKIAQHLVEQGHSVSWIVENHLFVPSTGKVYKIPYPTRMHKYNKSDGRFMVIKNSDRMVNYFGKKNIWYYAYYHDKIKSILLNKKPDFVFGECALFHELLTIDICRKNKIIYLNPSSCRYPLGRFSFYKYDTLVPYRGSGERLSKSSVETIIEGIKSRSFQPDYMRITKGRLRTFLYKIYNSLFMVLCYLFGERYNTPSPVRKALLIAWLYLSKIRWKRFAKDYLIQKDRNIFIILFPLQMQPEVNIDVWGRKFRDQVLVLKKILDNTDDNVNVLIKPNPKIKYELNERLIQAIKESTRAFAVPFHVTMSDVLQKTDLIITITGSIAIEAICINKPVLTLVETMNNKNKNCIFVDSYFKIMDYIQLIRKNSFPVLSNNEKIQFIKELNEISYKGIITDPFSTPSVMESSNIIDVSKAFEHVIDEETEHDA